MTIFYSAFALSVVSISFSFVINNFLIYWLNFPELFNLFIDFWENNNDLGCHYLGTKNNALVPHYFGGNNDDFGNHYF